MKTFGHGARRILAMAAISAALALPASAQATFNVDEDSIVKVLGEHGLKADLTYDDWTGGAIISSFDKDVKANFEIRLDACDEDGAFCTLMVMSAGFFFEDKSNAAASHQKINEWNRDNWGKAYVTEDNSTMWISVETSIGSPTTKENFEDTLAWFQGLMRDYTTFIEWQAN